MLADQDPRGVNNFLNREAAPGADFRAGAGGSPRATGACSSPRRARPCAAHTSAALLAAFALLFPFAGRTAVAADAPPDWRRLGEETADLLSEIIRIDTSNPPGNEAPAAAALDRRLAAEGIETEIVESAPGRGNVYARLRGGGGRPVILLAHLDVVPADGRGWHLPPFSGTREHGYVHGRGALDAKGVAAVEAMTMIALKRSGKPLSRDLILLATADEEAGGRAGAGWLVQHRPDLLGNAEFLLTEGDHIHLRKTAAGKVRKVVQVAVAEKTPCWLRLTAHGDAGHGSTPPPQTSVTRLIRALNKLRRYRTAVRLVKPVEDYFAALAPLEAEPLRGRLAHLRQSLEDPSFLAEFTRNPQQNALLRNTLTPTVLSASPKTNVIPAEASAELDCRLLPGEHPGDFLALVREIIGDDSVRVEPILSFPASASDPTSAMMDAIRDLARREFGGVPVVPSVIPGFTDSHYFREHGVASYGFVPFVLGEDDERTVHGIDERVSVENLRDGVERLVAVLRAMADAGSSGALK